MENTKVYCPICGDLTEFYQRRKKHRFRCPNNECGTHLEIDREFIFLDESKKRENEKWRRYRYQRLTFDELDTVVKGGRVSDKEHDIPKQNAKENTASKGSEIAMKESTSKTENFVSKGTLCPFSWIQVTKPAGCLPSIFGGGEKVVWEPQSCMSHRCKLWSPSDGDCGLITKK